MKHRVATLGSHSALQILKGAKDEGFETIAICEKKATRPYKSFGVADEIIELDSFKDFAMIEQTLIDKNAILIPHGSLVAYLGPSKIGELKVPHFGTKGILKWEADRNKQREWLHSAGLKLPRLFANAEDIDRPVIVKFHGARGGRGYFLARTPEEFKKKLAAHDTGEGYAIQEYVVGVPVYAHYFYSPLAEEIEIMGFDKRYESNADSIGRVAAADQITVDLSTSYTVVGNVPIVIRESLLPMMFDIGESVIKESQKIEPPGLMGAFCLEGVVTSELEFYVFEISARIVAGTNPYVDGSPYTALKYKEPMSTGRRIAREIKRAIETNALDKILH
ncbi:MAG: formate--phosphoribosylaminoimidazolecarboxamide ligase [Candidatus Kaiserbacteria bacterium]|nr:formate--phosphoribosylaminoimidazolecarboxamide ligase [Candidatus Kaiserbacteria bacterium]